MQGKYKKSMLEYSKIILTKISFDKVLFRKEYTKAVNRLTTDDRTQLNKWVRSEWEAMLT